MKPDTIVLIRHKVANYRKWKEAFDEHGSTRKAHGSKGGRLYKNADNPKEIVIVLRWNDLEKARQFLASDDLRWAMARAGVSDMPDVYLLEELGTIAQ